MNRNFQDNLNNPFDSTDEEDMDRAIEERKLCPQPIPQEFPVMKLFRKWRPFRFNASLNTSLFDIPFSVLTKYTCSEYIQAYIQAYIYSKPQSGMVWIPGMSIQQTRDREIETRFEMNVIQELDKHMQNQRVQNIAIQVNITDDRSREVENLNTKGWIFIYKPLERIECFHPDFEDFFSGRLGKEILNLFSNEPLNIQNLEKYMFFPLEPMRSSEILQDFLEMFPFIEEQGYLRKSYRSFEYLWSIYVCLSYRVIPGYTLEEIERIQSYYDQWSDETRIKLFQNFYIFLQCLSSFIWNTLSEEEQDSVNR